MSVNRFGRPVAALAGWGLFALATFTCVLGAARLYGLAPRHPLPPAYPDWTVVHFAAALGFVLLAVVQLTTGLGRRLPRLHRISGRLAAALGLAMGVSGLAMAYLPQHALGEQVFMTSFFLVFCLLLLRGVAAARAGRFEAHRAWMIGAVATALTPITQRLIFGVFAGAMGVSGPSAFWEMFVAAAWLGWLVNLAGAQFWLRPAGLQARAPLTAAGEHG